MKMRRPLGALHRPGKLHKSRDRTAVDDIIRVFGMRLAGVVSTLVNQDELCLYVFGL